ncbi:MAG: glycosyltransferase family 4 protein [Bryobacteraceae bacterium]
MTRLLVASTVPSFVEAFLLPYARHFRARGWRVDAMANGIGSNEECAAAFDRVWDIKWSRNPLNPANLWHAPAHVQDIIEAGNYDIVHVHTPVAGLVCRYSLRNRIAPVRIYTAHGFHFHENGSVPKNLMFLGFEKLAARWTDYLVVINRSDEAAARRQRFVAPGRLVYMPGIGLDTRHKYSPDSVSQDEITLARRALQLTPEDPVLLMLAEFIPRKRHADALRAFARLDRPRAQLLLAGAGPTMPAMKKLAHSLGIAPRVHFLGIRRDVPVLIRAACAVLLCSQQEGLPRSVMEALALGTPVIGSDIRGTRELLEHGAGYLYKLGSVEALCRAAERVLDHPVEAAASARLGRERIAAYDLQRILAMHEDLYAHALEHRLARPFAAVGP